MTVINGIEIDIKRVPADDIKLAIMNNDPLDTVLHVIAVTSNPCQIVKKYILAREFLSRMELEKNIKIYMVELAYGEQKFYVTEDNNPRHLQIKGKIPLWHKENLINMGVKELLPKNWKAMAWIDADIEFEDPNWALNTLKVLNGCRDVVQLFSHAINMDIYHKAINIFPSFGFQYIKNNNYESSGINMWHPGYAWACTKKAYDKMEGLYDVSILGSGDHCMAFSFIGHPASILNSGQTEGYKETLAQFQFRCSQLRLGYIPGIILHHFHGLGKKRKYSERWQILAKNQYDPTIHIKKRKDGLIIPTTDAPQQLLNEIMEYFFERNEDENFNHFSNC